MFGGDATVLDPFTLSLLGNPTVLAINSLSGGNRQVSITDAGTGGSSIVWTAEVKASDVDSDFIAAEQQYAGVYVALFNTAAAGTAAKVSVSLEAVGVDPNYHGKIWNVWTGTY